MTATASIPVFMRIGRSGETFEVGTIELEADDTVCASQAEPLDLPRFLRAMADEIENTRQEDD